MLICMDLTMYILTIFCTTSFCFQYKKYAPAVQTSPSFLQIAKTQKNDICTCRLEPVTELEDDGPEVSTLLDIIHRFL